MMERSIQANTGMTKSMGMEFTSGLIRRYTKETGMMGNSMGMDA